MFLFGLLCIFGIQYMLCKSSSWSLDDIPNEVRTYLWLSSTSDAEKSMRLYVGFPGSMFSPITLFKVYKTCLLISKTGLNFVSLSYHLNAIFDFRSYTVLNDTNQLTWLLTLIKIRLLVYILPLRNQVSLTLKVLYLIQTSMYHHS